MRLWQQSMISLARNQALKHFMQNRATMSKLAMKFVGGNSAIEAIKMSQALKSQNRNASFFFLGEYIEDLAVISQTVLELKAMISLLKDTNLDIHISVDPTQIGYQINENICHNNAFEIATEIKKGIGPNNSRNLLMLDMEDSIVTEATLRIYNELITASLPAAVTLQAYLFRTEADLGNIIEHRGAVRLVKGAFAERKEIALTKRSLIDDNYLNLAAMMLSKDARQNGFYPIFATHDQDLISKLIELAGKLGWEKEEYEFEMLYGVRPDLQEKLIQTGEQLRLYLPFGTDWWPYAVRRIGENPRNAKFLLRSIFAI